VATGGTATEPREEQGEDQAEDDMLVVDIHGDDNKFALHGRMATAIVEIMKERGECAPRDLAAKGFTPDEIKRCWAMAKALAHVELNWMDS
jgi:pantothenate kinase